MTIPVLVAVLTFALWPQQTPQAQHDEMFEDAAGPAGVAVALTPNDFHTRLQRESRYDAWADEIEPVVRDRYERIPGVATGDELRVTCGSTVCEIVGRAKPSLTPAAESRLVADLQAPSLEDTLRSAGLKSAASAFGVKSIDGAHRVTFASYWTREQH